MTDIYNKVYFLDLILVTLVLFNKLIPQNNIFIDPFWSAKIYSICRVYVENDYTNALHTVDMDLKNLGKKSITIVLLFSITDKKHFFYCITIPNI